MGRAVVVKYLRDAAGRMQFRNLRFEGIGLHVGEGFADIHGCRFNTSAKISPFSISANSASGGQFLREGQIGVTADKPSALPMVGGDSRHSSGGRSVEVHLFELGFLLALPSWVLEDLTDGHDT